MRIQTILTTIGFAVWLGGIQPSEAEQLITPAEAALPSAPDAGMALRGITRGPAVEQVSPAPDAKSLTSPLALKIRFEPRNNATIDKDSVKVTYVKTKGIDLTPRIKAFLTDDGIDMKQAEIPPGAHLLRVDVKDSQGRASTALIKLSVEK